MKLTIGMPHYDDYTGVFMTVQALKLYHDLEDTEIIVVDNSPTKNSSSGCKVLLDHFKGKFSTRYIPMPDCRGPAHAKNEVIKQAKGDVVLVMDCHVMLEKDAIKRLKSFNIDDSFYTGPLLMDDCVSVSTHFDMMWRGGMWGVWSQAWQHPDGTIFSVYPNDDKYMEYFDMTYERKKINLDLPILRADEFNQRAQQLGCKMIGKNPDDKPFKIPGQGCGLFIVRRDSWLGFNDNFYGFGGEEGYIHTKYAKAGRPTICLPFMRWNHFFRRGNQVPYPVIMQDRIRNYVIGFTELGLDLEPVKKEFIPKDMSEEQWQKLIESPISYVRMDANQNCNVKNDYPEDISKLYEWAKNQNSKAFPNEYLSTIRAYSGTCPKILEVGQNSFASVAIAAGNPEKLDSFRQNGDSLFAHVSKITKKLNTSAEDILSVELNDNYDLIFLESNSGTHEKLTEYLNKTVPYSKRYIIISGVTSHQMRGSDGGPGYGEALKQFCKSNPEWFLCSHVPHGHGLAVLSKNPVDKPAREFRIWPMDNGPGHFLKQNLKKYLGIESTPNCSCNQRALMMDIHGPEWCRENIKLIVTWLKEEYERRRNSNEKSDKLGVVASLLPFNETAATILIKTSIRQSEKCQSKKQ